MAWGVKSTTWLASIQVTELNVHPTWNFRWIFHLTWNFAAWCAAGTGQTEAFGRGCVKTAKQSLSRFDPDIVNPFSFSQAHKLTKHAKCVWCGLQEPRIAFLMTYEARKGSCPRQLHRLHHSLHAQDADHPLEVIGQHMQAHLRAHMLNGLRQEVCPAHPVFQRAEDVFHCAPA